MRPAPSRSTGSTSGWARHRAQPRTPAAPRRAPTSPRRSPWGAAGGCGAGGRGAGGHGGDCAGAAGEPSAPPAPRGAAGGSPGAPRHARRPAGTGTAVHRGGHRQGTGTAVRGARCPRARSQAGDTHRELGVVGSVSRGLLGLVGVVVEGGAEEAGLHLVALPAHQVGAARAGPVLHGAPGVAVGPSVRPSVQLCPHPSLHPSISKVGDPLPPSPSLPVPVPPGPRARRGTPPVAVGSPEVAGAGPAAPHVVAEAPELGLRGDGGDVGQAWGSAGPWGGAVGGSRVRGAGPWGRGTHSPRTGCRSAQPRSACSSSPR